MGDGAVWMLLVMLLVSSKRKAPAATTAPKAAPAAAGGTKLSPGDHLAHGAHYHATIKLSGVEAMFGTASAVKSKLEGAGFTDVAVTDRGGGAFEATGVWNGGDVAAKLPPQVQSVERIG